MIAIFLGIVVVIAALAAVGWVIFTRLRKTARQQKAFERSLKMVPLLIHLPPPSDDTQVNGRDTRDVTDETISRAQIIYNIIGSTLQKDWKAHYYGQRHFAFEIIGSQGFVNFYAVVPVALVEVIKQAIVSAYPAARLEEVSEHNIFSKAGMLSGVWGGELHLKQSYAYPIATYQDLKRDALQSVLNSLSTLEKEDGAAIQMVLRPAEEGWRKTASTLASKKRKGNDKGFNALRTLQEFVLAFARPPEEKKDGGGGKELSNLEQANLDAIDDKTRHVGYEVQIRIVASSNISQRAQNIASQIVASFSLFDAPGKNGFKFSATKDPQQLVADYNMRAYSVNKKPNILNAVELATLFHFPDQRNLPTTQVIRQDSKQVDGPRNIPDDGILLGYNLFRGVRKPIRIGLLDRQRHMYAVGQTGTGKSTYLENLAFQDMLAGNGFAFVDPHGDTAEKLLSMIPKERTEDVIYFNPGDMDNPLGLNLFEFDDPDQKDFLIQEALNMLYKLYDPQHQGIMGPRYEHLFRMAALTIMADPAGGTFVDIPKLFRDPKYVDQKLQYVTDQNVVEFWKKEMPQSQRSNDFGEVVSWFVSKFGAFLSNEMMRNIIGQTESSFNLRDIMDNKKILLVNLSKGRLGDLNSKLLGMIFVMKFQAAAMSRANIPEDDRVDFCLYVDEFQNFSTDSFATIMSEARKYHLNLVVANQFTTQLTPEIRDAVFGNMGTIVSFRIGQNDVEAISKYFQPTFDADDLLRIPNHNSIIRTLIGGVPTQPFSMAMLPPLGNPNPKLAEALKQLSAAKHGRPRAQVEKEIFQRMATKADQAPSGGLATAPATAGGFGGAPPAGAARATAPGPTGTGNFLDEWLSKRPAPGVAAPQPVGQATAQSMVPSRSQPPVMSTPTASTAPQYSAPVAVQPSPSPQPSVPFDAAAASTGTAAMVSPTAPSPTVQMSSANPALPTTDLSSPSNDGTEVSAGQPSSEAGSVDDIMRQHSAANAQSVSGQSNDVHNISSSEVEREEVSKIADELKQQLASDVPTETARPTQSVDGAQPKAQPPTTAQETAASKTSTEKASEPAKAVKAPKTPQKAAQPLSKPSEAAEPNTDTITIDQAGTLTNKQPADDAANKS